MTDNISQLPATDEKISEIDINILNTLFENKNVKKNIKKLLIPGLVFLILNIPMVDSLMKNLISNSTIINLIIKTLLFLVILWIIFYYE